MHQILSFISVLALVTNKMATVCEQASHHASPAMQMHKQPYQIVKCMQSTESEKVQIAFVTVSRGPLSNNLPLLLEKLAEQWYC